MSEDVAKSEGVTKANDLWYKYKKICFDVLKRFPYGSVPTWIKFSDGKVEEALKEERSITKNVIDYYAVTLLSFILSAIGFWYIVLIAIALFGLAAIASFGVVLFLIPFVLAIVGIMLILMPIFLILMALCYHVLIKLLGGVGTFRQTLSVLTLASIANIVLNVVVYLLFATIIGVIASPISYVIWGYSLYLEYKGFKYSHKLSRNRAIIAVLGGFAVIMGLFIVLYLGAIIAAKVL